MYDRANVPLVDGDLAFDEKGRIWRVREINMPSIFRYGYRIPCTRIRIGRDRATIVENGEITYIPVSMLYRLLPNEVYHPNLKAYWQEKYAARDSSKSDELRARRKHLDDILVARGIRK